MAGALSPQPAGHHPVRVAGEDFSDLSFLKQHLTDVRIVQLGENGHGAGDAMKARERIARFLHAELGFTVLAFESSLFQLYLADESAASGAPETTLRSLFGVWHTREMLPLFSHMQKSRHGPHPLRLAGFDVQPIGTMRRRRPQFFAEIVALADSGYAQQVRQLDERFLAAYDQPSAERRTALRKLGDELVKGYEALALFIERKRPELQAKAGRIRPLIALQEARSAASYVRYQTTSDMRAYVETRDQAMFENLRFIAETLFPGQRIIVWGHNFHLRYDNASIPPREEIFPGVAARTMGAWTRDHFKGRVFTIGQHEFEGTVVDNSRNEVIVSRPAPDSLEARLQRLTNGRSALIMLSQLNWTGTPVRARYNAQYEQTIVPAKQYDALLFLPRVTPPTFLY